MSYKDEMDVTAQVYEGAEEYAQTIREYKELFEYLNGDNANIILDKDAGVYWVESHTYADDMTNGARIALDDFMGHELSAVYLYDKYPVKQ